MSQPEKPTDFNWSPASMHTFTCAPKLLLLPALKSHSGPRLSSGRAHRCCESAGKEEQGTHLITNIMLEP